MFLHISEKYKEKMREHEKYEGNVWRNYDEVCSPIYALWNLEKCQPPGGGERYVDRIPEMAHSTLKLFF